MTTTTLNFLIEGDKILLAMKKRGFGEGKWNGVGGKLHGAEAPEDAIVRETEEEVGVKIEKSDLEKVGVIDFHFYDKPEWDQQCHVFLTKKWEGEPTETEEMKPEWYSFGTIPYELMWVDDKYWLPLVLEGKKFKAEFYFNKEGDSFDKWKIEELK